MSLAVAGGPRIRRGALALLTALFGLVLALSAGAAPAWAHAELLSTSPESGAVLAEQPAEIELHFNEHVQPVEGAVRLFPSDGEPVDLTARVIDTRVMITLPPALADNRYAVTYRVVSADGHPISGILRFQIGEGKYADPAVGEGAGRAVGTERIMAVLTGLHYLGLLGLAGLLFFHQVVLGTAEQPSRRTRRLLWMAFGTAAATALLLIPVSGARVAGIEFVTYAADSGSLVISPVASWWSGISRPVVVSAALVAVFGLIAALAGTRGRLLATGSAAVALGTPLLVGHTQTVQPGWLMLLADYGHLAAGAFWLGGVIGLVGYLLAARTPLTEALPVVARFSKFALISVGVLAASGVTMAVLILGSWSALLHTDYGRTLLIKLGIVGVVVVLAAWNRFELLPRIAEQPAGTRPWRSLRRALGAEAVLLLAVLAVTGFLTNASPRYAEEEVQNPAPRVPNMEQASWGTTVQAESQGMKVDGVLVPTVVGENTLVFRLDYDGKPLTVEQVDVSARLPAENLGPLTAVAVYSPDTEAYQADLDLPVSGDWQLQISARVDTYTQPIAIVSVTIP